MLRSDACCSQPGAGRSAARRAASASSAIYSARRPLTTHAARPGCGCSCERQSRARRADGPRPNPPRPSGKAQARQPARAKPDTLPSGGW